MHEAMAAQAPAELLDGFARAARRLDQIDFAARAPQMGELAPDFVLTDQVGEDVHLAALLRGGPVVLIFYRGEWCPYCNLQLRSFQAHLDEFAALGAQLVAISPQMPDHSLSMAEKNELGFRVLSDVEAAVIDRYGLRYEVDPETRALLATVGNDLASYNGKAGWVLPAVATFVIAPGGDVRYANVRGDWTERAEPTEVLAVLDGMANGRTA
jgi:peroxiredoxin